MAGFVGIRTGGKPPRLDGTSDRLADLPGRRRPSSTIDVVGEGSHRALVQQELQILVLFYGRAGMHLFAVTNDHTEEVDDEGNRCDGPGRGNGRDEVGRAA